jgi:hypothetical protein
MKTIIVVALSAVLAGCGLCPTKVEYLNVPVEVKIPVPVKCKVTLPPKHIDLIPMTRQEDGYYEKAMSVLGELEQYRMYSKELEAAVSVCVE